MCGCELCISDAQIALTACRHAQLKLFSPPSCRCVPDTMVPVRRAKQMSLQGQLGLGPMYLSSLPFCDTCAQHGTARQGKGCHWDFFATSHRNQQSLNP
jgi:hypothetical protein